MTQKISGAGGIDANLAPDAFHLWARHYYICARDFRTPDRFSPVPYFLLCRSIELGVKAHHLVAMSQDKVKRTFGHDLILAYHALPRSRQILTHQELGVLRQANNIYHDKGFEYFEPEDALTAFKRYPDLGSLAGIAKKLIRDAP